MWLLILHHRQARLGHQTLHRAHPLFQPCPLHLASFQMANRGERASGDGRCQRGGEDEARCIRADGVAAGAARGDITAHHAEALGESAIDDVDAVHHAVAFGDAAAARTVQADRMHLVEISERAICLGEVADGGDRRDMTVHRIDALEDNDLGCPGGHLLEQLLEMLDVVMAEDVLLAAAPADALDHRGVILLVGEDHQPRHESLQGGEGRIVGDIGRGEEQRRLLAVQIGELGLELHMIVSCSGDIARAARARADLLDRLMHGVAHNRVLAHAEIIVGAPHRHVAGAAFGEMIGGGVSPAAALQIGEDAVAAFLMQRLKVLAETGLVIHLCLDHLNLWPASAQAGGHSDIVLGTRSASP